MKLEDLRDYRTLRRCTANPWEIVRFRKTGRPGQILEVRFLDEPPLFLRGGASDFHMFHRINLRDEYRLRGHVRWDCVVDLGGNVGLFAARAAQTARRVITYEPVPENYERLLLNCDPRPRVEPVCAAVAARPGPLRIYRPRNATLTGVHSSFTEMGGHMSDAYDDAEAITLDQLFARHEVRKCNLLKLDVEGQEYEILHAASDETLARIDRIHAEYHNVQPEDPSSRIENFEKFLESKDYEPEVVPHRRKPNRGMIYATRVR
jgi:FkbM family methyltransferase